MRAVFVAALAVVAVAAQAGTQVVDVVDGNTLVVQAGGGAPQQLRLGGISAPLPCQPWGPEARDALREWAKGYDVTVQGGKVLLDGTDLSRRMVEEGHAWSTRTKWDRGPYVAQERMAQALKRGMHSLGQGKPPQAGQRVPAGC